MRNMNRSEDSYSLNSYGQTYFFLLQKKPQGFVRRSSFQKSAFLKWTFPRVVKEGKNLLLSRLYSLKEISFLIPN